MVRQNSSIPNTNAGSGTLSHLHKEVVLAEVLTMVWRLKRWVAASSVLFAVLGLLTLHMTKYKYVVRIVIDVHQVYDEPKNLELEGLGFLKVPGSFLSGHLYQQLFTSTLLAERIEDKYNFYNQICVDGSCQPSKTISNSWLLCSLDKYVRIEACHLKPKAEYIAILLRKQMKIVPLHPSQYFELSLVHTNPELAKRILEAIYREVGELALEAAQARNRTQILQLVKILAGPVSIETRLYLAGQLLDVKKDRIRLDSRIEYVTALIESPTISRRPIAPNPIIIIPLFSIAGIIFAIVLLVLASLNSDKILERGLN